MILIDAIDILISERHKCRGSKNADAKVFTDAVAVVINNITEQARSSEMIKALTILKATKDIAANAGADCRIQRFVQASDTVLTYLPIQEDTCKQP